MLIGQFYNETGQPTDILLNLENILAEGRHLKAQSDAEKVRFPPCNSEWSTGRGGRVWCSPKRYGTSSGLIIKQTDALLHLNNYSCKIYRPGGCWFSCSGGVIRDWAGVPRRLFSPASSGVRCVCVQDAAGAEQDPNLQKYDGCPADADSCVVGEH